MKNLMLLRFGPFSSSPLDFAISSTPPPPDPTSIEHSACLKIIILECVKNEMIELLKWGRDSPRPCPWSNVVAAAAARLKRPDLFLYCLNFDCPLSDPLKPKSLTFHYSQIGSLMALEELEPRGLRFGLEGNPGLIQGLFLNGDEALVRYAISILKKKHHIIDRSAIVAAIGNPIAFELVIPLKAPIRTGSGPDHNLMSWAYQLGFKAYSLEFVFRTFECAKIQVTSRLNLLQSILRICGRGPSRPLQTTLFHSG